MSTSSPSLSQTSPEPSQEFKPPWHQQTAFVEKPTNEAYGYVLRGKLVACSREELIRRCGSQEIPHVALVWHPDSPRVVPAAQVPFLFDALKHRATETLKTLFWVSLLNALLFGLLAAISWGQGQFVFLLLMFAVMGAVPIVQSLRGLKALKRTQWPVADGNASAESYRAWVASRAIRFTWIILASLIAVGALQIISGLEDSIIAAGLDKAAVRRGQWWRLLTGPLLHGSVIHLSFNGMALIGLGRVMEVLTSRFHLAVTFLVAALVGSLVSLLLLPHTTSVGASGGLLGLIGFLLVLGYRRKIHLPPGFGRAVMINVVLIGLMGALAYSIIDNAAHLGGFLAGVATGCTLIKQDDPTLPLSYGTSLRIAGTLALALILCFGAFAGYRIIGK